MTIVKVLLRLGSPNFVLVHIDKVHSENVTGIAHALEVHCSMLVSDPLNLHNESLNLLTFVVPVEGARIEHNRLLRVNIDLDIAIP